MGLVVDIIKLIVVLSFSMVSLVYSIKGAQSLANSKQYNGDSNLANAHKYLTISSTLIAIILTLIVVGFVVFIIFGSESIKETLDPVIKLISYSTIVLEVLTAILNSIAMYYLYKYSGQDDDAIKSAKSDGWYSMSGVILALTILAIDMIYKYYEKKKKAKAKLESEEKELEKDVEIAKREKEHKHSE